MSWAPQTFAPADLGVVLFLIVLEALLSADNALILAILVRHLPEKERARALMYGLVGALGFRFVAVFLAGLVLKLWWLQGLGAAYLVYLPVKHFLTGSDEDEEKRREIGRSFWATVVLVELTDLAFAIDSILAGIASVGERPSKLWVIWLGGFAGVVLLRVAASMLIRVLEKYPALDRMAYVLVGWVGIKMVGMTLAAYRHAHPEAGFARQWAEMHPVFFWSVLFAVLLGGVWWARRAPTG